jgi:hypothetical protein
MKKEEKRAQAIKRAKARDMTKGSHGNEEMKSHNCRGAQNTQPGPEDTNTENLTQIRKSATKARTQDVKLFTKKYKNENMNLHATPELSNEDRIFPKL